LSNPFLFQLGQSLVFGAHANTRRMSSGFVFQDVLLALMLFYCRYKLVTAKVITLHEDNIFPSVLLDGHVHTSEVKK
jgi:hypothetical protein